MNSPVEERLREALAEAGATVDTGALRPLRAPERRGFRMDFRLVAVPVAVVLAGAVTAVVLGAGGGEEDRAVAGPVTTEEAGTRGIAVFLCTASAPLESPCDGAVTPDQTKAIQQKLTELPAAESVWFVSSGQAYEEFRTRFSTNKQLLDEVKLSDMPSSFRVKGMDLNGLAKSLHGLPGILSAGDLDAYPVASPAAQQSGWDVSVVLCEDESILRACGAVRTTKKNGAVSVTKAGKGVTEAERTAIEEQIKTMPEVESYVFEDQATAYQNFKKAFKDNKTLQQATKVSDMPMSFRINLKEQSKGPEVISELRRRPGVGHVAFSGCMLERAALSSEFGLIVPERKVCRTGK